MKFHVIFFVATMVACKVTIKIYFSKKKTENEMVAVSFNIYYTVRHVNIHTHILVGLRKKTTCLRGLEAAKLDSRKAEINCGFMSTIVYDGSLDAQINFFNKIFLQTLLN